MREASQSVYGGDDVAAQQMIQHGEDFMDAASKSAGENLPEDSQEWVTVQSDLLEAASVYKESMGAASSALDSGKSSEMADALSGKDKAVADIDDAQHRVRVWYVAHGGKASDIYDFRENVANMSKLAGALGGN